MRPVILNGLWLTVGGESKVINGLVGKKTESRLAKLYNTVRANRATLVTRFRLILSTVSLEV